MTDDFGTELRKWELSHYTTEELIEEVNRRTEHTVKAIDHLDNAEILLDDSLRRLDSIILNLGEGFNQIDEQVDLTDPNDTGERP